ncbi:MAG TPA: amino acid adenylation domain-containing protein, partial [Longimicrobiaceae bacterium]|nr:amino acid adenylation domain-containing protein [Longimicrobiaceae bacterium]
AAEHPDIPLSHISFLLPEENYQVVTQFNATAAEYPRDASVPALFAEQARATPDAVALTTADGAAITYAELEARSNRLARHLRARGVTRGTRVGLSVARSPELITALLAIVKAGAAYVPLDPSYPAERLAFMAGDAGLSHLVVLDDVPDALAAFTGDVVRLHASAAEVATLPGDAVEVDLTGDDLCYVIYTSGSTGQPKGVAVPHRGVVRLVKANGFASFAADEVFLQLAPIAFDASTFEVWGPLLNGARLVLYPPETPSLDDLGRFIESRGITTLWLTAGLFHQMVDTQLPRLRGVRQLLAGGDVLSPPHVARAIAALPDTKVINGYGPTESTTFTACHLARATDVQRASIPIGRPIANTRVYVLDAYLRPAPLAVAGDLYIGGDGLAHGYLNQPAMTAERFIPDFYGTDAGGRLYRSGDRARWMADGTLEFLGRADEQVKIRGFRIELGEIEAALGSDPRVAECVVVAREDVPGDRRLVAYAVPAPGVEADGGDLRDALQGRLPAYMVPAIVVLLPELPLTANGKVDRRALPAPDGSGAVDRYVAPRTETEHALAEIWAECLATGPVGVHDNFFELGGHSLVATRVVSRIREAMDTELPLRALFEAQTVGELAARIDADRRAAAPGAPPLVPVKRTGPVPASFAQARLWFVERMIPGTPTYNVPTPLPLPGAVDDAVLERTLGEIVRRHEALRTTFTEVDGQPMQVIHPAGGFRMEVVDLRGVAEDARGAELGRRVGEESMRPFDLEAGPLFRATLYRITDADALLLPVMHHVVSDGWSCDVLLRELNTLYGAFAEGRPSPLPELPIQYADFAVWQRAWLQGDVLNEQLAFWKGRLAGAPPVLELPTDRPRPPVQTFRGRTVSAALPRDLTERLNVLSRAEGGTLFMTLLAAFSALLGRWSGQTDVVIGSPIAGRTRGETEGLIGFFVNNLAMRTDLSGAPTFRELIRRARETTLDAYAHQDLPFERLVEELGIERSVSHSPVFQVLFNLLTQRGGAGPDAPPPPAEVVESDEPAKYDLTLTINDVGADVFAAINYNADLFDGATARRMLAHFRLLLEQVAARPDIRLDDVDLLPAEERALVVGEWNDTARP